MINMILANAIILFVLFFLISWLYVSLALYFILLIIAQVRRHKNIGAIAILNVVLGWTFLGWLVALLWALNSDITEEEDN